MLGLANPVTIFAILIRHGVGAPIDLEQKRNTRVVVVKKNAVDVEG
jgi:hypothetical protein